MNTLALKLSMTPILILAASLAGRRWGEAIGGWLVGLPLTSGPVAFFLTLDQGPAFAQQAAAGSLAGTAAQACFALGYFWAAGRARWPLAFSAGVAAYAVAAASLQFLALPHLALFCIALLALTLALRAMPRQTLRRVIAILPLWDLPARMAVATTLVVAVTAGAATLGPRLSGLIATFPIFATVLTVFAHHVQGAPAARQVLRGLLLGLYGFAVFFVVLSFMLTQASVPIAFLGAGLAAMLVQGVSFKLMRRSR
ncbi:MAG: hypothetical protein JO357_04420 [Hyphomicrobiales bacterium]|nr:hypothetical protein [Hyphomicrobiales bacterium]MBV9051091.1 hypothetical protein [Hyphomicrobiales bacterium]MBV9136283.1 hypothetical protein [Hyphomicrobiales bacterium]MBV9588095.1 hypothetical protein [Hyphomicrobiales bacterium]MBV9752067.1 hypothetical protein [Hyphomicrobiales bacterium]